MLVDPKVFLSRPQDLSLDDTEQLSIALAKAAEGADKITILSAYYGTSYLAKMFAKVPRKSRVACTLTLVFGIEIPARMPSAINDLKMLRSKLVKLGFPSPTIRIFDRKAPFHTKLYYFKRATRPAWFVGSANASGAIDGARHEMMVRLTGRHDGLAEYTNAVVVNSVNVEDVRPKSSIVRDIRSFFLQGSLCYAPSSRLKLTFEACRIGPAHREVLKRNLAETSSVPHADPQTEGFSFSLAQAVAKISKSRELRADDEAGPGKVNFKHFGIETVYGFWLPAAYAADVRQKLRVAEQRRIEDMQRFGRILLGIRQEALDVELNSHVDGLMKFFASHDAPIEPRPDYRQRFVDFVRVRSSWLSDSGRVERMARRLHIEQMPDIWDDVDAAAKFETSFFEDLAIRFDAPRATRIIEVLKEELPLDDTPTVERLRSALLHRLNRGFSESVWWGCEE